MQFPSTRPITLHTIGHSDRDRELFIRILQAYGIRRVVDIRARPSSRRYPQHNRHPLREALRRAKIHYHWAGQCLGGFRPPRSRSIHQALRSTGLQAYADHMQSEQFRLGIAELLTLASDGCTAILCAERDPANCHRLLVADYLTAIAGLRVQHIIGLDESSEHRLSPSARLEDGDLIYDQPVDKQLELRVE